MPSGSRRHSPSGWASVRNTVKPGYEDVWYYLWKERKLPTNVDPLTKDLEDAEERKRLARIFDQGLDHIVGYALPLRRARLSGDPRWVSGPWFLRREHMFLIPGDSPMGFRLPLDSLPWSSPEDIEPFIEADPFAPREPLVSRDELAKQRRVIVPPVGEGPAVDRGDEFGESASELPRRPVGRRDRPDGPLR